LKAYKEKNMKKALVIGAGIAGIAAAIRLQVKGYAVDVYETHSQAGGKLAELHLNGCRFDKGASLFTLPEEIEDLFTLAGENINDFFAYSALPVITKYFYEDGLVLNAYANPQEFAAEIANKTQDTAETVLQFLAESRDKYELTADVFLKQSLHKFSNFLNFKTVHSLLNIHKLDAFRTMAAANRQTFKDDRVLQLFNRYATYNGSNPYQTPATLNVIPHLEHNIGAYFPKEGMYGIVKSLVKLAEKKGVQFHYNTPIQEIIVENKKAVGIRLASSATPLLADKIVCNVDVVNAYRRLLPKEKAPEKILAQPKSSSALIFYWAMHREFPQIDLHNIFFSKNYAEEFRHLFDLKTIYEDPTVYVFVSAKQVPTDAPKGYENWFVMINVPNNTGQDWEALKTAARQHIIKKLSRILQVDVSQYITAEDYLDPVRIEAFTSSSQGALYGNSSNNRYAAFLRHANFSTDIKNLYFCGGSVHPGGGVPLCLLSAKIVAEVVG
jgi:phytoene desaturase